MVEIKIEVFFWLCMYQLRFVSVKVNEQQIFFFFELLNNLLSEEIFISQEKFILTHMKATKRGIESFERK